MAKHKQEVQTEIDVVTKITLLQLNRRISPTKDSNARKKLLKQIAAIQGKKQK